MNGTIRKEAISFNNGHDEALSEWDAQEAIERARIAKEHGFKPLGGFRPTPKAKTPPLSKEEQEKANAEQQKALQRWLDGGLPKAVTEQIAPNQSPVAGGLDDVIQSIKDEYCTEPSEPIPSPAAELQQPEPELTRAPKPAPSPVVKVIEAAVKQLRPRKPTSPRKLPHGGCTGVWIPKEVYEDPRFDSFNEMILYLEINHLDQQDGCTAKNKHFSDYLGCNVQTVQDMIRSMTKRGIFLSVYPSRTSRIIHIAGGRKSYPRHRG